MVVTVALVTIFGGVFLLEFVLASNYHSGADAASLSASTYMDEVERLLVEADPTRGEALLDEHACQVCHAQGANNIAPPHEGVATLAAQRRPPLTAAAYLYEAIVYPAAHIVEGYPGSMPTNYGQRLSERELGDILAYLLTQEQDAS